MKLRKLLSQNNVWKLTVPLYVVFVLISIYHLAFAKRIIPGVKVGDTKLGGVTYSQAVMALQERESKSQKILKLKYEAKEYEIKGSDITLTYDHDSAISRAFEVGRTGNIFIDTKDKIAGLFKNLYITAFYDYENEILNARISEIQGEVNQEPEDAKYVVVNNTVELKPARLGKKLFTDTFTKVILASFDKIDFSDGALPVREIKPRVVEADLIPYQDKVKELAFSKFYVTYEKDRWDFAPDQLLDFASFSKEDKGTVEMGLNDLKFESLADVVSQTVNKLPRGKVTQTSGDRVVSFEITQGGREVDVKKFSSDFKNAFFGLKGSVDIPVKIIDQPATKDKYGIFALLGTGTSKFTGSGNSRINNLALAAERTNGVLVPPGEVYSMSSAIGDVSSKTGFDTAYVISGGRTVLGSGGGVCQTSTTLFRAVLYSGLPVVMRYPHDYRVGYYEIDSPVGMDASIFQPSIDFKFKNDTSAYILVQSETDRANSTLTFKIFGTPDGRTVSISDPVVTNVSPPPATLYQNDPTLPKGVVKQIDFSAWGATASFKRTVKKNDTILFEDTYTTRYQPWRAVYLVGTKQ